MRLDATLTGSKRAPSRLMPYIYRVAVSPDMRAFLGWLRGEKRMIEIDGASAPRKMDVRLYTYDGQVLLAAARLYQGQTTNFRTPGGGFAPVLIV